MSIMTRQLEMQAPLVTGRIKLLLNRLVHAGVLESLLATVGISDR